MTVHRIVIPGWQPTRLNQLLSVCWQKAARLKKADRQVVTLYARQAGIRTASTPRRVSLEITLAPRQRAGDPDAYWKSCLDALVCAGALVDDSRQWVELGPVTFGRGQQKGTVIVLEELPA